MELPQFICQGKLLLVCSCCEANMILVCHVLFIEILLEMMMKILMISSRKKRSLGKWKTTARGTKELALVKVGNLLG